METLKHGTLIALAAASLFAAACKKNAGSDTMAHPADKSAQVACAGVNACKGMGECKTANNGCAGQNGCKSQGIVNMSEEKCRADGGTVQAM